MRKRIAICGANEETLALVPLLEANPEVEIPVVYDPDPVAVRARLALLSPATAERMEARLTDDLCKVTATPGLHAVIDSGLEPPFASAAPEAAASGVQIVSPLTARLLWGYGGVSARDHKGELLRALHEVVESYNLTVDTDELFSRMLEIALGVTGAEGGSLMLVDAEGEELQVRVAVGLEPELWSKVRVRLGEGIAGRAAQEGRALRIRGKADRETFRIVRERLDVESALCVPLIHEARVLGVLNLHHATRPDLFADDDLAFVEQLAQLDAEIIARAQEHESLRHQAARYAAVREVRRVLDARAPLPERLQELCGLVARRVGRGIATVYLYDPEEDALRLAATSLHGGGFGGEYRITLGEGVDGSAAASRRPTFLDAGDALAYAALPLLVDERLVGLLALQAGRDAPRGRAVQESLLEIAAATADAVAQAEREARMSTRATKVGAINEMGIKMLSATDLSEVTRLATSSGSMILEADHAVLRLQDPDTGRFVIRSYFGAASGRQQEQLFRLDKTISVESIKRRTATLIRDVAGHEAAAGIDCSVRSLMASPLRREGRVVGTLAFYDKVAADSFYATVFNEDDFHVFTKYVTYVERSVANAAFHAQARRHRSFDEETGLPNAGYLARRLDEEIARAGTRQASFALAVCRIENWNSLVQTTDPVHMRRVTQRVAEALRTRVRPFDVPARIGEAEYSVLMPDPGDEPGDGVSSLARAVADDVAADDDLNEPARIALAFGYAVSAVDGSGREELLAAAGNPRIRTL